MSNYNSLKATINANIKTNGNQEITGSVLNSVLKSIVDSLGAGYLFMGVATPETNPGTPDQNVAYLANQMGRYSHFGFDIGKGEISVLKYNGVWTREFVCFPFTDRNALNAIFDELYITGFQDGYYFSYFTWNGSVVTAIIRDSANNIIWFSNGRSATAGEVFEYSQGGITLYAVFNSNTHTTSPETSAVYSKSFSLADNPKITDYLFGKKMPLTNIDNVPTEGSDNLVKSGGVYEAITPVFTDRPSLNAIFDELYVLGKPAGSYFSYFTWNGSVVTAIIRDSANNIIWFSNGRSATAGEVFEYSQNGITIYAIFNTNTYGTSPQNTQIGEKALSLEYNPGISSYIFAPIQKNFPLNVSRFNLNTLMPGGTYNASWISIARRCDDVNDSVFCFANKTAQAVSNKFFDFYLCGYHARGKDFVTDLATYLDQTSVNVLSSSDALLVSLIVGAVNNADGDNLTNKWRTGGSHGYGNTSTGSPTMRELSNDVRVDGKLIPIGAANVRGRVCTIDVVSNIQGYNTCKENGGGREIIQQRANIRITNDFIETTIEYVALEEVIIYGNLLATGLNVRDMDGYRFVGSQSKPGLYVFNGTGNVPSSDDNAINALRIENLGYLFDTEYDLSYGLGNKRETNTPNLYVTTSGKAYFEVMPGTDQIHLYTNDSVSFKTRMYLRKK